MPVRKIQPDDLLIRIKWIMLMRVILVTFLFGVTILASFRSGSSEVVSSFTYLYFLIAYSYLLTGLSAFFYKYVKRLGGFSYFQIVVDIFFITGILQITGGVESPFVFLYFLSILSGSLLLYQKGSLIAAIMSALSYMVLVYINKDGLTSLNVDDAALYEPSLLYYKTFLNLFSFFIIAFLGNQLAKRLKIAGEEIQQKEESIQNLQIFHENIIQSIKSGLITTDLAGKITSVNRSGEKIIGIGKEEILQLYLVQLFPYPEVKQYLENNSLEKGEESSRFEVSFVNMFSNIVSVDGPSAGGAITATLYAALANKVIDADILMTGTIEENGQIGKIGGAAIKAAAAKEQGAKKFLVPVGQKVVVQGLEVKEVASEEQTQKSVVCA